jgi:hypothetical protein
VAPDRLIGLGEIPWTCLNDALGELSHCAEIGLKGVVVEAQANDTVWQEQPLG